MTSVRIFICSQFTRSEYSLPIHCDPSPHHRYIFNTLHLLSYNSENGIPWVAAKDWLKSQPNAPWNDSNQSNKYDTYQYPEYYTKSFHAYSKGNLSYDAAFEQELASRAIGARNFPKFGSKGEDVFRGAFEKKLEELGACVSVQPDQKEVTIVDFGCGTGTSTRRLAQQYSKATQVIGIDLSPYFIDVGQTLLKLAPDAMDNGSDEGWITSIDSDARIQLQQGDIANTQLPSNSASVVNIGLVAHELPTSVAKKVVDEAYRILQPNGQLWISEMDFESPAYRAQRENAMLFSLLRATEPYLDEYADGMPELRSYIVEVFGRNGGSVKTAAATGRHYALVAEKGQGGSYEATNGEKIFQDFRFRDDGTYAEEDTHLKPWESKDS
jgi:ubiquinone/menaquinone biosynthesis C-methylase UbiE